MIVADTSAILAIVDRRDQRHEDARDITPSSGAIVIPVGIMGELAFMVEPRVSSVAFDGVLGDIELGNFVLDCGDVDIPRIRELIRRYADFPLGYSDAAVIACAERLRAPVFTFDRRHFAVVAREGTFSVVP